MIIPTNAGLTAGIAAAAARSGNLTRREVFGALGRFAALTTGLIGCRRGVEQISDVGIPPRPDGGFDGGFKDSGTDAGMDAGMDTGQALPTSFRVQLFDGALPCHYPAQLAERLQQILGVCAPGGDRAGDRNHLFQVGLNGMREPIPASLLLDFPRVNGRSLNSFTALNSNRGIVTANDGFYEVTLSTPTSYRFIPFPAGYSYGGGAQYAANKLFIATANLNGATYFPGKVLVYDVGGGGSVVESNYRSIPTTGLNPTGMAPLGSSALVVLNSGDFGSNPQASLDLVDTTTETMARSIPLGNLTAQVSGEMAVTADGTTAIVGTAAFDRTASYAGRLLFVNLRTRDVSLLLLPGTLYHPNVKIGDGRVYVPDFNSGILTVLSLAERAIIASLNLGVSELGPSVLMGNDLFQGYPYGLARITPT